MVQPDPTAHSSSHVLVALLEVIVDRQADALEQVKAELETLSHRIFSRRHGGGQRSQARGCPAAGLHSSRWAASATSTSRIRESLLGVGRIVPYVGQVAGDGSRRIWCPGCTTLQRDIASLNDFDTHLNDKVQFLLDAMLGFINIAQNNVMKVLTVVSVVGMPPTLVASIYGMNFKNMPELDWAWGYACGLVLIVDNGA